MRTRPRPPVIYEESILQLKYVRHNVIPVTNASSGNYDWTAHHGSCVMRNNAVFNARNSVSARNNPVKGYVSVRNALFLCERVRYS